MQPNTTEVTDAGNAPRGKSTVEMIEEILVFKFGMSVGSTLTTAAAVRMFNGNPYAFSGKSIDELAGQIKADDVVQVIGALAVSLQSDVIRINRWQATGLVR